MDTNSLENAHDDKHCQEAKYWGVLLQMHTYKKLEGTMHQISFKSYIFESPLDSQAWPEAAP